MLRSEADHVRWLWLIVLSGLALRLFGLADESLWLDEIITANRVHESMRTILFGWDSETQGPLYYVWVKGWGLMFGTSEFNLRIWSVIWGTLTIYYVYQLGRMLFTGTGAVLAALFIAVHPFAIHYSQEARPYALLLLLSVASVYFLLRLMRQHSWSLAWTYVLITAAAFYTHAFGVFLILSHIATFLWFRRESRYRGALRYPRPFVTTLILLVIVCMPEFVQNTAAGIRKIGGHSPAGWINEPTLWMMFKLPLEYFMDMRVGAIILPIVSVFTVFRVLNEPQLRLGFQWLIIMGACFWLIPWVVSIVVTPIFVLRYTAPGLLVIIFLMSTASASLQALPRQLFVTLLLVLTVYPLWDYYTKVDKDPWRQMADYLVARVKPEDRIVGFPLFTRDALEFYLPEYLRTQYERPESVQELNEVLANASRVWEVVSYDSNDSNSVAQLREFESWGTELRRIRMNDELKMNPHRYWSAPIQIALRERRPALPEPIPNPDL